MKLKVFFLALTSTLTVSANDDTDSTIVFKQDLSNVTITGHNEIRMLREAAMPVSVLEARQLDGTATSINDVLARTTGVTIRNTGGVGSASRVSVRGLEGKRMGVYVDEAAIGQLSDYM